MAEKEYIEREAIIKKLREDEECDCELIVLLYDYPAADVAPVKHGEWEEIRDAYRQLEGWMCKKCGRETKAKENYCPNCGAKMDGCDENV
jgi:hypothetical protein